MNNFKTLLKRFFFGTPENEVNIINTESIKDQLRFYKINYKHLRSENQRLKLKLIAKPS